MTHLIEFGSHVVAMQAGSRHLNGQVTHAIPVGSGLEVQQRLGRGPAALARLALATPERSAAVRGACVHGIGLAVSAVGA